MKDILERHKETWEQKKILRVIYEDWYKKIISDLKKSSAKTIELGAGSGNFKEFYPDAISADIDKKEWLDMSFDAHNMPFENDSAANLVMIDVLHHLHDPLKFLKEAYRVLENGGRLIMLEPFPSFFSTIVYKLFHPEPFDFGKDYFGEITSSGKNPWDSNQAIPYLIFFKHLNKFEEIFGKKFDIIKKEKLSFLAYPLSGGFENKSIIPSSMINAFMQIEKMLTPFRHILAFRCYIVLEKNHHK